MIHICYLWNKFGCGCYYLGHVSDFNRHFLEHLSNKSGVSLKTLWIWVFRRMFVKQVLLTGENSVVIFWATLAIFMLQKRGPDNNCRGGPDDNYWNFLELSVTWFCKSAEIPVYCVLKMNTIIPKTGSQETIALHKFKTHGLLTNAQLV